MHPRQRAQITWADLSRSLYWGWCRREIQAPDPGAQLSVTAGSACSSAQPASVRNPTRPRLQTVQPLLPVLSRLCPLLAFASSPAAIRLPESTTEETIRPRAGHRDTCSVLAPRGHEIWQVRAPQAQLLGPSARAELEQGPPAQARPMRGWSSWRPPSSWPTRSPPWSRRSPSRELAVLRRRRAQPSHVLCAGPQLEAGLQQPGGLQSGSRREETAQHSWAGHRQAAHQPGGQGGSRHVRCLPLACCLSAALRSLTRTFHPQHRERAQQAARPADCRQAAERAAGPGPLAWPARPGQVCTAARPAALLRCCPLVASPPALRQVQPPGVCRQQLGAGQGDSGDGGPAEPRAPAAAAAHNVAAGRGAG